MQLDNREIASLLWFAVFIVWALSVSPVRSSFRRVLASASSPAVGVPILLMCAFVWGTVAVLRAAGLWTGADLKNTLLWLIGFAFISLFETPQIAQEPRRLKVVIREVIGLLVIVEFVMNAYVMALWIELLFVPAITLIVLLAMVAESKKEHAPVAVFLRVVQSVVVLGLLSFVIWKAVEDRQAFLSLETLKDVALPVALSVSFVPFLYAMALFIAYDSVFRLFGWRIAEPRLRRYARRRTLVTCHLRLRPLGELVRVASRTRFDSREAVDDVLRKCQVPAPA